MRALSKIGLASVVFATSAQQALALDFGGGKVDQSIQGNSGTADTVIQGLVAKAMMFLGILAVLYGIWGGFQIMTAAGEEDKVKKGKTILVQAAIGLVVIYLANSLVQFVLGNILGGN